MESSKVAIVSTSINPHPSAYSEWATAGTLIVAGDLNSPSELAHYVRGLGGVYLEPKDQGDWTFSEHIGWQNIQRRNTAIMWAYATGRFDYILTVDDDNHPLPSASHFVDGQIKMMGYHVDTVVGSYTQQLNTGIFTVPGFHQRGVPYGINTSQVYQKKPATDRIPEIVVCQAQVLGDPDCDAVERMVNAPNVNDVLANVVVEPGIYAAFNSQATMWKREWAPVMAVLPGIGRYDDIFASFIFHRLAREYNVALYVGAPVVEQVRNVHDLVKDLRAELWGMNNALTFCDVLNTATISSSYALPMAYEELIYAAEAVLPPSTIAFAHEWIKTWKAMAA